jgi:D-methionine transport system permease protein
MMEELLKALIPNVMTKVPELIKSFWQTLYMMGVSGVISFVLGLTFGIILTVTKKKGIMENAVVYNILDKIINTFRSIPFIILLAALIPLTRAVVGTAIGTKGAILPLVFGTVPFFTRQIETALAELDGGLIEASQAMGSSPVEIIYRVYLKESIPSIVRVTTITFISLVGLTAMAGAVGGGGLGDFAIRYGHQRNQVDVTYVTVIILLIVVNIIQGFGNFIIRKTTH